MDRGRALTILGIGTIVAGAAWYAMGGSSSITAMTLSAAYQIPPRWASKTVEVARAVGANPFDLAALIEFESDGWNPAAVNPSSGAVGLIQFMPATLRKISKATGQHYTPAGVRQMSAEEQLDLVQFYLALVADGRWEGGRGPLDTPQRLYLAVFYPKARYWHETREFPQSVQNANPGVRTVADYVRAINTRARAFFA